MQFVASLAAILMASSILWVRKPMERSPKSPIAVATFVLYVICSLTFAVGAGSCALGGFLKGSALCSITTRRETWHPVGDFYSIQAVWSSAFLLALWFALMSALALFPGNATPWQRLVFLATAGRHGAWRDFVPAWGPGSASDRAFEALRERINSETDTARKAELLSSDETLRVLKGETADLERQMNASVVRADRASRALRAAAWLAAIFFPLLSAGLLVPLVPGAVTDEALPRGLVAASLLLSAIAGFAGLRAIRLLRTPHDTF